MATITFHNGFPSNPALFVTLSDILLFDATLGSLSTSGFVGTAGIYRFEVSGTGLSYGLIGGFPALTGGTVNTIDVLQGGVLSMRVAGIGLTGQQITGAIQAEFGGDVAAVERMLTALDYTYVGNAAADVLRKGATSQDGVVLELLGNDTAQLGGGNDAVFMGAGNDTAFGEDGNDRLEGGDGFDLLDGGDGRDGLFGGAGDDTLSGGGDRDRLDGGRGNDMLDGGDNHDRLDGGSGNDTLSGGGGADTLTGGQGRDVMTGGSGSDVFRFLSLEDTGLRSGADLIIGFRSGTDTLDMAGLGLSFDGAAFSGAAGSMRFVLRDARHQLQIDADGDTRADAVIFMDGTTRLTADDFIL